MADTIKSYLVSLSANVDKASFDKFASALAGAEKAVASSVGAMAGKMLAFQVAGTTAFASVGFGVVSYIDKLGRADLMMKQHALQNMMSVQQYRAMTMALDTMGVSLEDVFNGTTQMKSYFTELINDETKMNALLGKDFEQKMTDIQDVQHQLDRLELKAKWFGMEAASDLLEKLGFGQGGILLQLERLNDFVLANMPRWSEEIVDNLVPALEQTYDILKKTGGMFLDLSVDFDNFIGTISGDDSINKKSADFESFARAVSHVVFWAGEGIKATIGLEKAATGGAGTVLNLAKAGGELLAWNPLNKDSHDRLSAAWKDLNAAADQSVVAAYGFKDIGAALLPGDMGGDKFESPSGGALQSEVQGKPLSNAQQIALDVSKMTGIRPDLIYGQMGFETGGFKSFAGKNNFSGIKIPGTNTFQNFSSISDYEKTYASVLNSDRYVKNLIRNSINGEDFARALKTPSGTYYGNDSESNYAAGVDRYAKGITIGTIVIQSAPSMTPEQHTKAIKKGVGDALKDYHGQAILATGGAYAGG